MSIIRLEESKERWSSAPCGIKMEIQALEHDNVESLKDGEVILA